MTQVKICGVKRAETVALLAEKQVDFVGFVFAKSRRQVTVETAAEILRAVPNHSPVVGVFVNPTLAELEEAVSRVPLQVMQLHGQESVSFCAEVKRRCSVKIWKALAVDDQGGLATALEPYKPFVDAFLFDTHDPSQAGGTGKRFSWNQIPQLYRLCGTTTCVIAGGINETNVSELLQSYAPPVIDISSGVETDGEKDHQKIISFLKRVREHE